MADMIGAFVIAGILAIGSIIVAIVGKKMHTGKLTPNSFAGVRTPKALQSKEDWYAVQSSCSPFVLLLSLILFDSSILFIIQGLLHKVLPILIPCVIMAAQLCGGIALVYRAALSKQ